MALFKNAFTKLSNLWPWRKVETIPSHMQTQQAVARSRQLRETMQNKYKLSAKQLQATYQPPAKVSWWSSFSSSFYSTAPIPSKNYNKRPVNTAKSAGWWSWPFAGKITKPQNISTHLSKK